jgi:excisionase family DNA binding protein
VRWVRYTHGLKTPQERLLQTAGKLTVREMAVRLGLPENTTRDWARDGRLKAVKQGRKPIWLIDRIDEQPREIRELAARRARQPASRPADSTAPALRARIDELLLDGHHDASVAEQLNTEGWTRTTGTPFDGSAVRSIRKRCGLETLWARWRADGKITTAEMAVSLGIGLKTVGNWVRAGRLRGRLCGRGTRPRWLFDPVAEQPEQIRRLAAKRATMPPRRGLLSDAAAGRGAV